MPPESFLFHSLTFWRPLGYAISFFGMIFEGDIFLFLAAFLTRLHFFDFFDMLFTLLAGVLAGDSLWYWSGRRLKNSNFFLVRWAKKIVSPFDQHIKENNFRTILLSKFAYGVHHLTLFRNGMLEIPYRDFVRNDFIAALVWVFIIGGLGYLFGGSYYIVRHYLKYAEVGILVLIILFWAVDRFVGVRLKKKL